MTAWIKAAVARLVIPALVLALSASDLRAAKDDPKAKLVEPERGERHFVAPATVPLAAEIQVAPQRSIVRVEFFHEETLIGEATSAPFEFQWTNVPQGDYRLRVRATDSQGATDFSPFVRVRVLENVEPRVRLTEPNRNASFTAPATVLLQAHARDRNHNLARVEFYANGALIGESTAEPYGLNWGPVTAGEYVLLAKAIDALGASDTSRPVTIRVTGNIPPTAILTSPTPNAVFTAPGNIPITAAVADSDGTIASVDFFNGTILIASRTTPPYSIVWTGVPAGAYSLTARVTDNNAATVTSNSISVTVNAAVAKLHFIHVDHLNTARAVYDYQQQLRWRWDQAEPFGISVPDENPFNLGVFKIPLRFPGQYGDSETGLAYNLARDYDSQIGRFVQSDPIGLAGGSLLTYGYVDSDPLSYIDPLGLDRQNSTNRNRFVGAPIGRGISNPVSNVGSGYARDIPFVGGGRAAPAVCPPAAPARPGTALSPYRYTQPGETFLRYESGNPSFTRITPSGGVTPGTYAAAGSDGVVPLDQRAPVYNLPDPNIPRPQVLVIQPPPGTLVVGPRPVAGGTGNEVVFPNGF